MFQKNSGGEKVFGYAGGVSRLSIEKFLSHSAENFRRGGEFFSVSLIWGIAKKMNKRGGEYQDFPSEIFCLTVPKK